MKNFIKWTAPFLLVACATQTPQMADNESSVSPDQQRAAQEAQQAPVQLALKRKIAVGRLSNETTYGKSLLSSTSDDSVSLKVTDMFVQSLINSGNYLVFERPDISLLQSEAELTGTQVNIIGVDTLVIGSLTEFGRSTTGESGFLSNSKTQEATATIDLRLVDTATGQVLESVSGTGSSSIESSTTMGFGSVASYDGSLNDQAIGAAVNAAVEKMTQLMLTKVWTADVLTVEDGLVYFSGGESQGIQTGMQFAVFKKGRQVKSSTTGSNITLPGQKVADITVLGTFGDTELEEGSFGEITGGSIDGLDIDTLEVREVQS